MPWWPALVTMASLPVVIMACFTVVGANAVRRGKQPTPADMAPLMPWFTLAGFAVSSGIGVAVMRSYDVPAAALRWGLTPAAGLIGAALGAAGAVTWFYANRALSARRTASTAAATNPALGVRYPLLMLMGACAGPAEEWVFRGIGLAVLEAAWGLPAAAVAVSVVFGLAHAYQGLKGIAMTTAIGAGAFLPLVLALDSLFAAMVAHSIWDLVMITLIVRRRSAC